jgi:dihydrofolate synthase / folylpolyglutamate synthase
MTANLDYATLVARLESSRLSRINLGLHVTQELLSLLGNPHEGLEGALVAGTNGKGSVCATLDAIARAAGRRTTMMVKPHLQSWTERIMSDGRPVSEDRFALLDDRVLRAAAGMSEDAQPTGFEILTAMGFLQAADEAADVVICEVGLGGRLDSTNVADLGVVVITNVSRDHLDLLGDRVEQIAFEKAAIIKPGNQVVTAAVEPGLSVIVAKANEVDAELTVLDSSRDWTVRGRQRGGVDIHLHAPTGPSLALRAPLAGSFQAENLAVAATAARLMGIEDTAIATGALTTVWPGRLQWIDGTPPVILDGAHNPAAMRALRESLPELVDERRVVAVFGAMRDKLTDEMLPTLREVTNEVIFTRVDRARATSPYELSLSFGGGEVVLDVGEALKRATDESGPDGVVLVTGSLALVGAALSLISNSPFS